MSEFISFTFILAIAVLTFAMLSKLDKFFKKNKWFVLPDQNLYVGDTQEELERKTNTKHFHSKNPDGSVNVHEIGRTSFTSDGYTSTYKFWEIAE